MVEKRRAVFVLTYIAVSSMIIVGVITMLGGFVSPEVHVFVHDFDFEGEKYFLILRFESNSGVFVTGEKIDVNAFLMYSFDSTTQIFHLLYFPDSLDPQDYQELLPKKNF